jgi:hypothetical protein
VQIHQCLTQVAAGRYGIQRSIVSSECKSSMNDQITFRCNPWLHEE